MIIIYKLMHIIHIVIKLLVIHLLIAHNKQNRTNINLDNKIKFLSNKYNKNNNKLSKNVNHLLLNLHFNMEIFQQTNMNK